MDKSIKMTAADVELVTKETPFNGYFRVDRYHLRHRQFEGGMGQTVTREIFERGHAVGVLLYDPDLDVLVFIEQFRAGVYAALASPWYDEDTSPWMIEIVAGIIEEGENPADVARREVVEEAGCQVLELEPICHYFVTPGGSTESVYAYCGHVDASAVGGIHGLAAEGENIRVFTMTPDEAFAALDEGRIQNSMSMIPVQWFRLHHQRLRTAWRQAE